MKWSDRSYKNSQTRQGKQPTGSPHLNTNIWKILC